MHKAMLIVLTLITSSLFSQTDLDKKPIERKGFIAGLGIGAGVLSLNSNDTSTLTFSATLPNIKVGFMANSRLAILALLPGANYKHNGKPRGFEGLLLAGQYWVQDNWWLLGGAGLTFDAPAFYTVKDPKTADFYTGIPALSLASGYEIWHKERFALDIQYRLFFGTSNLPNNEQRRGISNTLVVGFNWY